MHDRNCVIRSNRPNRRTDLYSISSVTAMRRIVTAAAAAAIALTGLAAADTARAGTDSSGPLTITANNQSLKPGCTYYPISYDVNGVTDWILSVNVTGPHGGGDYLIASSDQDPDSGTVRAFLCDSLDGAGTYSVEADLTNFNGADSNAATTFVMSKARTSTSLTVSPTRSKTGGYVTYRGDTNYVRDNKFVNLPYSTVTILYLVRGTTTWHTLAQFDTDSNGNYSKRYKFNFKSTVHYHARVEESDFSARSYSPTRDVTHY